MGKVIHELEPIFDADSQVLILGTMPSPKSRQQGFYYAHPQNRFWPVMADIFHTSALTDNDARRSFLHMHHIALWDVLASCEITGASDSSITQPIANPISELLNQTRIHSIFTTGMKSAALYRKLCLPQTGIEAVPLPSTSPANCRSWTYEKLCKAYSVIPEALHVLTL